MPSKRGKGNKRDAPMDVAVEKTSKKPAYSHQKTPPKKRKAGKKGKSATSVPVSGKRSATTPMEIAIESTTTPSKAKSVVASSSKKKFGKKSVASRPPKGQRKASTSSSSPDEEQLSTAPTRSPPKKKNSVVPPPFSGAASRTRSKSGFKVSSFSFLFHRSLSLRCSLLCFLILLSAAAGSTQARQIW